MATAGAVGAAVQDGLAVRDAPRPTVEKAPHEQAKDSRTDDDKGQKPRFCKHGCRYVHDASRIAMLLNTPEQAEALL